MIQEKIIKVSSGYMMLALSLLLLAGAIFSLVTGINTETALFVGAAALLFLGALFLFSGLFAVYPNTSRVLSLFGDYVGTVKQEGFKWANPLYKHQKVSLRARNLNGEKVKVNDALGNPIIISVVVVWQVDETAKAAFEVDDYEDFVSIQSEAAMRTLANSYPYDNFDDDQAEITLRAGGAQVNKLLEKELTDRLERAGINILEARISHLAYAQEIAQAMLKRQQATAVVAARYKIVEGAVSMVDMALDQLKESGIVDLDEDKKAAMVSNLMVVLCSDKDANPIVNAGTLYN